MNTNTTPTPSSSADPKSSVIAEIRKLAIVVALGAIGYVAVDNLTSRSAADTPTTAAVSSQAAQASGEQRTPETDISDSSSEVPTHLIVEALKSKTMEVNKAQPVVLRSVASRQAMEAARSTATQQVQGIQAPSMATTANGSQPLPIIGYYKDGSAMTEQDRREQVKHLIEQIPADFTINWEAENEIASIYVFTDPTCPFCKRLHDAVPTLNAAGISVRYFLYPRDLPNSTNGTLSPTARQLANAWCSVDQKQALDEAFAGYRLPDTDCSTLPPEMERSAPPISEHYMLGTLFDVKGTPTMATSHGQVIEGFSNAQTLIDRITRQQ